MRILHTSDWHIGRKLKDHDRSEEFRKFFRWLEDIIRSENIDVLLIAGDIFDTRNPSVTSQEIYYSFLGRIAKNTSCRHIVIISGNHDSPAFLDAPAELLKLSRIHVIGRASPNPADEVITLLDTSGNPELVVCAVPFLEARDVSMSYPDDDFQDAENALKAGIREHYARVFDYARSISGGTPIIAMGHLFVHGSSKGDDEGERALYIGTAIKIESGIFPEDIAYTALGHLHSAQKAGRENIRYSGSPIAMTFGEASREKSIYILELSGKELAEIKTIHLPVYRKLEKISGNIHELKAQIDTLGQKNISTWIEAVYTGQDIIADFREQLNEYAQKYSCLEIISSEYTAPETTGIYEGFDTRTSLENFSAMTMFNRLMETKNIPEEQRETFRNMYSEIWHKVEAEAQS